MPSLGRLRTLILRDCDVQDPGALALARALRENRALTTLDLWRNGITSDGMQALAAALQVPAV